MNVALFGGSFDPPHRGHEAIMEIAFSALAIDKLYIVPTFLNPFKNEARFPALLRLKMMNILARHSLRCSDIEVLDFEVANGYATPTIQTVEFLRRSENISRLYLLLGADQLARIAEWDSFERLKGLVEFVIIRRGDVEIPPSYRTIELHENISSSEIRAGLHSRDLPRHLKEAIPECIRGEVLSYLAK